MSEPPRSTLYLVLSDDDPELLALLTQFCHERQTEMKICVVKPGEADRIIDLAPPAESFLAAGITQAVLEAPSPSRQVMLLGDALPPSFLAELGQLSRRARETQTQIAELAQQLATEINRQSITLQQVPGYGQVPAKTRKKRGWQDPRNRIFSKDAYTQKRSV